jgi:hypothetical protein
VIDAATLRFTTIATDNAERESFSTKPTDRSALSPLRVKRG